MQDWMKERKGRFISYEDGFLEKIKSDILGGVWFDVLHRVELFIGREEQLKQLYDALHCGNTIKAVVIQTAISGLGGIGKSELAREYAHKHRKEYDDNVIWINAEKFQTLVDSFLKLARDNRVSIPTKHLNGEVKDHKSIVEEVYQFFSRKKCLFVFDDAEKYRTAEEKDDGIDKFLPNIPHGNYKPHFIITSRNQQWKNSVDKVILLATFTKKESIDFIKTYLSIRNNSQDEEIQDLAETLQYFPLALQQAVAYIRQDENCKSLFKDGEFRVRDYLQMYKEQAKTLLDFPFPEDSNNLYTKTTFITWKITLSKIEERKYGQNAFHNLRIMSYFDPNKIPVDLFLGSHNESKWAKSSLLLLKQYSMIDLSEGEANIHKLVQQVTRLGLKEQSKENIVIKLALNLLIVSFPGECSRHDLDKKRQLLPHFEACLSHLDGWLLARKSEIKFETESSLLIPALQCMADGYSDFGNPSRKKELVERVLSILTHKYGPNHFEVAENLTNLANAYGNLGNHLEQKNLLERALPILEKHYDQDHFVVAITLENLGNAYGKLGNPVKQKSYLERALPIFEKHYGQDHFQVAGTLENLGNAYGNLGNQVENNKPQHSYY